MAALTDPTRTVHHMTRLDYYLRTIGREIALVGGAIAATDHGPIGSWALKLAAGGAYLAAHAATTPGTRAARRQANRTHPDLTHLFDPAQ